MYNNLNDLKAGTNGDITVMVRAIEVKTISGKDEQYQLFFVRDTNDCEKTFMRFGALLDVIPPAIVTLNVHCCEYRGDMCVKIQRCAVIEGASYYDYLPKAHIDTIDQLKKVTSPTVKGLRKSLYTIVSNTLNPINAKYMHHPLTTHNAFSRQAGIHEATLQMVQRVKLNAELEGYDCDMMLAAALLYYIGSIKAINDNYVITREGKLYSPGILASKILTESINNAINSGKIKKEDVNWDELEILDYLLLARDRNTPPVMAEAAFLIQQDKAIRERDERETALAKAETGTFVKDSSGHEWLKMQSFVLAEPQANKNEEEQADDTNAEEEPASTNANT